MNGERCNGHAVKGKNSESPTGIEAKTFRTPVGCSKRCRGTCVDNYPFFF